MDEKSSLYWKVLFAIGPTWTFVLVVVLGLLALHYVQEFALKF